MLYAAFYKQIILGSVDVAFSRVVYTQTEEVGWR